MKAVASLLISLIPTLAFAQSGLVLPSPQPSPDTAFSATLAAQPGATQRQADPRRRRPSMVGYIEDSIIASRIRLRFDSGLNNQVPDRAEFFYAKCGCFRDLSRSLPVFDPDAAGPGPGVTTKVNFQQLFLEGEYALGSRVSIFGALPLRWIQPKVFIPDIEGRFGTFPSQSGLSDIRAGIKLGLSASDSHALTVQFQAYAPSGDSLKGLGTNHWSVEPALLYFQRLGDRVAVESQVGYWHPTDGSPGIPTAGPDKFSGDVMFYGIGPSFTLYDSPQFQFTPVVELAGWRVLGGFQTAAVLQAEDINIVNLKVGTRLGFGDRSSIYIGYGHALTDDWWYEDIIRTEYRFSF